LTLALYRVFPWDAAALPGESFAPDFVPPHQGSGRFDLREGAVLYLGESPEHAVAEALQSFRGRPFREGMLHRFGHPLALVEVSVADDIADQIVDLDDPAQLARLALRPSAVASDDRRRTGRIAATVYDSGATGLRWWSKLSGDWHGVVLFLARAPLARLGIGTPELLTPTHPAVIQACRHLGIVLS
jgi:RES domain-containing protein